MLSMYPNGATNDQIRWRLSSSGLKIDASELLQGLVKLSERGEIHLDNSGRWRLAELTNNVKQKKKDVGSKPTETDDNVLRAVEGVCRSRPTTAGADGLKSDETELPEWSSILGYYAATQRHDPRGQIQSFKDKHGQTWTLLRTAGRWWSGAEIRVQSRYLAEDFKEALAASKTSAAALGWPVSVFHGSSGPAFVPGLIIPADWAFVGEDVVFTVEDGIFPVVNPTWVREVRARTNWSATALQDYLFPEGEEANLASVSDRMKYALAKIGSSSLRPAELIGEISIAGDGLRNALGIFLPEDGSFTKGAADDLETLRSWDQEKRSRTVLSAILDRPQDTLDTKLQSPITYLLSSNVLTESQRQAADAALHGPVTIIQGPPGTGKSQVIVAVLLSAIASGRTVLFAAKNHQAIDEVEKRLKKVVGDAPLLVRGRDADGERDTSFIDALADITKGADWNPREQTDPAPARIELINAAIDQAEMHKRNADLQQLQLEACEYAEWLLLFKKSPKQTQSDGNKKPKTRSFFLKTLLDFLRRFYSKSTVELPKIPKEWQIEIRLNTVKEKINLLNAEQSVNLGGDTLAKKVIETIPKIATRITLPDEDERTFASKRLKEIEFQKIKSSRRMQIEDAMLVLRHRPIWAVSTLSVPSRVPLIPCLFDYVIFDESSQCDIASALPLLARARKAIVVGDPMQLRFVPSLGNAAEHALMDAAALPQLGRAAFAQSINSLFDFIDHRPASKRYFLADQFRSSPAIVDYINQDFYGGKLIGRREDDNFQTPKGYKPGLTWENVPGQVTGRDGGNVNKYEAEHIINLISRLAEDKSFNGSVGVISPFNAQVAEIQTIINATIPEDACERIKLRIATVDKWQGAEADVILFSLVVTANAPASARTFLQKERRRLNVAVSRARAVCVIVGDLAYAQRSGIRHIEFLARKATTPFSPPKTGLFDSEWERRLDTAMRARGLKPIPQFPVGTRYLDFAIDPDGRKINVEVDGRRWHTDASGNRKVADILRDQEMKTRGWKVLRFWVHELAYDMEACVDQIERELGA
jgi:very-short-patch-repair endonuclease